ncbi:MAG: lipid kinase [Rhodospirillales bacterium]
MAKRPRRALVMINRRAARGKRSILQGLRILDQAGIESDLHVIKNPDKISELIRQHADTCDRVVIGGGDGTLSGATDALLATQTPLGILPMGNANDLVRTLSLPTDIDEAFRVVAHGRLKQIDVGSVGKRHFFNVASIGLSVTIAKRLTCDIKQRWGVLGYLGCAWEAVRSSPRFHVRIVCDGRPLETAAIQVSIGNGRHYGGGMTIVDDASIDDGRLDVYVLPPMPRWRLLSIVPALRRGTHRPLPDVFSLHGTEIEVHTDRSMPINVDGEVAASTPAVFRVLREALSVFVPPAMPAVSG